MRVREHLDFWQFHSVSGLGRALEIPAPFLALNHDLAKSLDVQLRLPFYFTNTLPF